MLLRIRCYRFCTGVPVDKKRVLSLGFSAGGFSAGQYAGNNIYSGLRSVLGSISNSLWDSLLSCGFSVRQHAGNTIDSGLRFVHRM